MRTIFAALTLLDAASPYQIVPNGQQRCGICLQFRPPNFV